MMSMKQYRATDIHKQMREAQARIDSEQKPVHDEVQVIPSSGREVSEQKRERLYHVFDGTIDKFSKSKGE